MKSIEWNERFRAAGSFVYCIVHHERRMAKIGVTKNVDRRFRQLQTGCADPLTLFGYLPGGFSLEKAFHDHFSARRRHGEWFDDSDRAITELFGRMAWEARMAA